MRGHEAPTWLNRWEERSLDGERAPAGGLVRPTPAAPSVSRAGCRERSARPTCSLADDCSYRAPLLTAVDRW